MDKECGLYFYNDCDGDFCQDPSKVLTVNRIVIRLRTLGGSKAKNLLLRHNYTYALCVVEHAGRMHAKE